MSSDLAATTVSRNFLDTILNTMRDILVVTDRDGSVRLVNQAVTQLLQYDEREVVGRPSAGLFSLEEEGCFSVGRKRIPRQSPAANPSSF